MVYRITALLDILFPPRPTELIVRKIENESFPVVTARRANGCWYLASYQNRAVQAAIIENKFHHNQTAARWLACGLEDWLQKQTADVLFVPLPLGRARQRERGHNQVESILKALDGEQKLAHLLVRSAETKPQSKLSKLEREENVRNAFRCKESLVDDLRDIHIILLDDVVTTGTTMAAARASLAPHLHPSVKLTCLALAHSA